MIKLEGFGRRLEELYVEIWVLINDSECQLVGAYAKRDDAIKASSEYVIAKEQGSDKSCKEISIRMEVINLK